MKGFHTDHYFQIGSAHYNGGKPCQDYALSHTSEKSACAVVSDGCSTGRHTDVGSRVLTFATLQAILEQEKTLSCTQDETIVSVKARQQQILITTKMTLGLESLDMLATCAYAYLKEDGGFVHLQGDGVFAIKFRNGSIQMFRIDWQNNTPFYPAYAENELDEFVRVHGGDLNASRVSYKEILMDSDGRIAYDDSYELSLREGLQGVKWDIPKEMLDSVDFIAVFTDGVTQVDGVEWHDAVSNFLDFKTPFGEFAKRRMIRGVKDYQKVGKGPVDDISYAVIRIEQEEQSEETP